MKKLKIKNIRKYSFQKLPIIEYIDETRHMGLRLLPKDPVKRGQSRMISEIINSGIQPYQNANVLKRIKKEMGNVKSDEWLNFYLAKGLKSLEFTLKKTSGIYCVGNEISIADMCLVPQIFHVKRNKIEFSDKLYPNIFRLNGTLEKIPEFV